MCGEYGCFVLVLGDRLSVYAKDKQDRFMTICLSYGGCCCCFIKDKKKKKGFEER